MTTWTMLFRLFCLHKGNENSSGERKWMALDSRSGLQLFAHFASEEIGSFTPIQMGEILGSFARLDFLHEDAAELDRHSRHYDRFAS